MALLQYLHVVFSLLIQTWMTSDLVDQSILFLSRVRKKTTKFQISMLPINDRVDDSKVFDAWAHGTRYIILNYKRQQQGSMV